MQFSPFSILISPLNYKFVVHNSTNHTCTHKSLFPTLFFTFSGVAKAWRSTQLNATFNSPSKNQATSPSAKLPLWTVSKGFDQLNISRASYYYDIKWSVINFYEKCRSRSIFTFPKNLLGLLTLSSHNSLYCSKLETKGVGTPLPLNNLWGTGNTLSATGVVVSTVIIYYLSV